MLNPRYKIGVLRSMWFFQNWSKTGGV